MVEEWRRDVVDVTMIMACRRYLTGTGGQLWL